MTRFSFVVVVLVAALSGCTRNFIGPDNTPPAPPTGLRTSTGDGFIELAWNENIERDVAGYNVYSSTSPNGAFSYIGSSRTAYYLDKGIANGVTYYYGVTAYDHDGNESVISREIVYDIPRPEGYGLVLSDFRTLPSTAGYDFSGGIVVPYADQRADMWYEYYGGTHYMDVNTDTDIQDMGPTSSLLEITTAPSTGWSTTHDVNLTVGHTYVVWTYDDHYAKFRVTAFSLAHVTVDWAYQLQASNPLLKRSVAGGIASRPPVVPRRGN
jgi:hypothetical protein